MELGGHRRGVLHQERYCSLCVHAAPAPEPAPLHDCLNYTLDVYIDHCVIVLKIFLITMVRGNGQLIGPKNPRLAPDRNSMASSLENASTRWTKCSSERDTGFLGFLEWRYTLGMESADVYTVRDNKLPSWLSVFEWQKTFCDVQADEILAMWSLPSCFGIDDDLLPWIHPGDWRRKITRCGRQNAYPTLAALWFT